MPSATTASRSSLRLGAPSERMVTLTEERHRLSSNRPRQRTRAHGDRPARRHRHRRPGPRHVRGGRRHQPDPRHHRPEGRRRSRGRARPLAVRQRSQRLPVPVVAAIEGPCLGGGSNWRSFCDVRVASDHAKHPDRPARGQARHRPGIRRHPEPDAPRRPAEGARPDPQRQDAARQAGAARRVIDRPGAARDKLLAAAAKRRSTARGRAASKAQGPQAPASRARAFWLSKPPACARSSVQGAGKTLRKGQARFYEAPKRALRAVRRRAAPAARATAFANEAKALGEMIVSADGEQGPGAPVLLDRARRSGSASHERGGPRRRYARWCVGGGVMGAGIAGQLRPARASRRGCAISCLETACSLPRRAFRRCLDKRCKRRRMKKHEATAVAGPARGLHRLGHR